MVWLFLSDCGKRRLLVQSVVRYEKVVDFGLDSTYFQVGE